MAIVFVLCMDSCICMGLACSSEQHVVLKSRTLLAKFAVDVPSSLGH